MKKFKALSILEASICLIIFSIILNGFLSCINAVRAFHTTNDLEDEYHRIAYAASMYAIYHGYLPLPVVKNQSEDASAKCSRLSELKDLTLEGGVPWDKLNIPPSKHKILYRVSATAIERPKSQNWLYNLHSGNIYSMSFANPRWYGQPTDPWDNKLFRRKYLRGEKDSVTKHVLASDYHKYLIPITNFKPVIGYQVPESQTVLSGSLMPELERLLHFDNLFGFLPQSCLMDGSAKIENCQYMTIKKREKTKDFSDISFSSTKTYPELSCKTRFSPLGAFFGLLVAWEDISPLEQDYIYACAFLSRLSRVIIFNEPVLSCSIENDKDNSYRKIWTRNELLYISRMPSLSASYPVISFSWRNHDGKYIATDIHKEKIENLGDVIFDSIEDGLLKRTRDTKEQKEYSHFGLGYYGLHVVDREELDTHLTEIQSLNTDYNLSKADTFDANFPLSFHRASSIAANVLGCASVPSHRFTKNPNLPSGPYIISGGPSFNYENPILREYSDFQSDDIDRGQRKYQKRFHSYLHGTSRPAIVCCNQCEYYDIDDKCSKCSSYEHLIGQFILRCLDTAFGYYSTKPLRAGFSTCNLVHAVSDLESDSIIIRFAITRILIALRDIWFCLSEEDEQIY